MILNLNQQIEILNQTNSDIQLDLDNTRQLNDELDATNAKLLDEVQLRQDLTSLIVDAARSYNLDPKLLAHVIKSESNFRPNPKHASPDWIGAGGVNIKAWKHLKHNPYSYTGNIYASAEILAFYMEDSDSLILALTRYKGISPMGLGFAKDIVKQYTKDNEQKK